MKGPIPGCSRQSARNFFQLSNLLPPTLISISFASCANRCQQSSSASHALPSTRRTFLKEAVALDHCTDFSPLPILPPNATIHPAPTNRAALRRQSQYREATRALFARRRRELFSAARQRILTAEERCKLRQAVRHSLHPRFGVLQPGNHYCQLPLRPLPFIFLRYSLINIALRSGGTD